METLNKRIRMISLKLFLAICAVFAIAHSFDGYKRYEKYPQRQSYGYPKSYPKSRYRNERSDENSDEDDNSYMMNEFNDIRNYIDSLVRNKLKNRLRFDIDDFDNRRARNRDRDDSDEVRYDNFRDKYRETRYEPRYEPKYKPKYEPKYPKPWPHYYYTTTSIPTIPTPCIDGQTYCNQTYTCVNGTLIGDYSIIPDVSGPASNISLILMTAHAGTNFLNGCLAVCASLSQCAYADYNPAHTPTALCTLYASSTINGTKSSTGHILYVKPAFFEQFQLS